MNKYRNIKTVVDGITFDSRKEADRYKQLLLLQRAGVIDHLQLQVPYTLVPKSKNGREVKYIADFVYWDLKNKREVIEDVKGVKTDVYKLKKRLMAELGHAITEV